MADRGDREPDRLHRLPCSRASSSSALSRPSSAASGGCVSTPHGHQGATCGCASGAGWWRGSPSSSPPTSSRPPSPRAGTRWGRLAAIALIRTFLDYFLERDLAEVRARQHEAAPSRPRRPHPRAWSGSPAARSSWDRTATIRRRRRSTRCRCGGSGWTPAPSPTASSSASSRPPGHVTLAERPANPEDYPGAKPEMLVPSSVMFKKSAGPVDLRNHYQLVDVRGGGGLAPPAGPRQLAGRALGSPRRARRLRGRRGLRPVGRQGAADRGRVGVRRARRARGRGLRLGRGVHARAARPWPTPGRAVPLGEPAARTVTSGRRRSARSPPTATASTTWPATSGSGPPTGTSTHSEIQHACCTLDNPRGGEAREELRPARRRGAHPRQGHEGRARTSARPTTATAIGRRRAWRSRSTPRPATWGSAASSGTRRVSA